MALRWRKNDVIFTFLRRNDVPPLTTLMLLVFFVCFFMSHHPQGPDKCYKTFYGSNYFRIIIGKGVTSLALSYD